MEDFATLAGLLRVSDLRGAALSKRDAEYLGNMISKDVLEQRQAPVGERRLRLRERSN